MNSCDTCKHAKITHGEQIIKMDGMTIKQGGGTNYTCLLTTGIRNISFNDDGDMICSSYKKGRPTEKNGESTVTIVGKNIKNMTL